MFSFHDLEMRFGSPVAWQCLAEIEKATNLYFPVLFLDPEIRLAMALKAQDEGMGICAA